MKHTKLLTGILPFIVWPFLAITAQEDSDNVDYELSPFTVSSDTDRGYVATSTVGGLKTNTSILETPLNIQVLNEAFLEDIGASSLDSAVKYISNVTGGDQRADSGFNIRGFGPTIYQDGLSYPFSNGFRALDGIERIEVIKGASAALYDTTALGGIINFIHKRPTSRKESLYEFTVGEHTFYKGVIDVNEPLHDDGTLSVAGRLIASYEDSESWRPFSFVQRMYVMPTVSFNWNDRTVMNLRFEYQKDELLQNFAQPYIFLGTPPPDTPSQATPDAFSGGTLLNLPHGFFRGEPTDGKDMDALNFALTVTHWLNDNWSMRFAAVASDIRVDRIETFISAPQGSVAVWPRFQQDIPQDFYGLSSELTLVGEFDTGAISHRALLGAALQDTNNQTANIRFALQEDMDVYNPKYGIPLGDEVISARRVSWTYLDTESLFFQDQIGFMEDRLLVVAGGRYQTFDRDLYTQNRDATEKSLQSTSDDRFFPRISGVFKISDEVSLFAGWSDTSTPNNGATDRNGVVLPDPTTEIQEIGLKGDLNDGKIFATLSYFNNVRTNLVVADVINIGAFESSGEITAEGIDLDVGIQVTDNFELIGGVSDMTNKITADTNPSRVGLGFRAIPDFTASVWARYDFSEDTQLDGLSIGLGFVHEGQRWGESANRFKTPAYTKYDLLIKYVWDNYVFRINVDNLTDEEYWGQITGDRFAQPANKRWAKATITARF